MFFVQKIIPWKQNLNEYTIHSQRTAICADGKTWKTTITFIIAVNAGMTYALGARFISATHHYSQV